MLVNRPRLGGRHQTSIFLYVLQSHSRIRIYERRTARTLLTPPSPKINHSKQSQVSQLLADPLIKLKQLHQFTHKNFSAYFRYLFTNTFEKCTLPHKCFDKPCQSFVTVSQPKLKDDEKLSVLVNEMTDSKQINVKSQAGCLKYSTVVSLLIQRFCMNYFSALLPPNALNLTICEHTGSVNLRCSALDVISVTAAFYGRRDTTT